MKLFDLPCRNTEICPLWKSCLECEWRVCVSSTDALVVFLFGQRFLDNLPADLRQSSHAGVLWFRMYLLPFWGLASPGWERNQGAVKFQLLWESMGNFCILVLFERYLSNACTDLHQILFMQGQCLPMCPFPLQGPPAPGRRMDGELKTQKIGGWSHSCIRQLQFLFFFSLYQMWSNMQGTDLRTF